MIVEDNECIEYYTIIIKRNEENRMTISIEHVGLWVNDLEVMKAFYEKYFAATSTELYHNPRTGFSSYFLSFSDGARLELCHRPDIVEGDKDTFGFTHLAIAVGGKEDVDRMAAQFVENGFELTSGPRTTGDGYYEAVIFDPEGNQIELTTH